MTSSNEALRKRVEAVLDMALTTVSSLTESFKSVASTLSSEAKTAQDSESDKVGDIDIAVDKAENENQKTMDT